MATFDLAIKDLTADELDNVLNALSNKTEPTFENTAFIGSPADTHPESSVLAPQTFIAPTLPSPVYAAQNVANFTVDDIPALDAAPAGTVDKDGIEWDERIHSGNRKITDKGYWQRRRGVQDYIYDQIKAELIAACPGMTAHNPSYPTLAETPSVVAPAAPVINPTPAVSRDFLGLIAKIQGLFSSGTVEPDYISKLLAKIGAAYQTTVTSTTDLQAAPHMVEYAFLLLEADGK